MKIEIDLPDYEILHPEIQRGLVEMARGACAVLVTAKRGKYPDDPALQQTVEDHLKHAEQHVASAWWAVLGDDLACGYPSQPNTQHIDDDGHQHMHHCTASVALAIARMGRANGD